MPGAGNAYKGDRVLDGLLAGAGKNVRAHMASARAVRDLLRGILAAPYGRDADAWIGLVAQRPGAALGAQLRALKSEMENRAPPAPLSAAERLAQLRARLAKLGIDGFIVGLADAHQGEYVPDSEARLAWLTGFTGSAGLALAMGDRGALFVDGRYTLQARTQADTKNFAIHHISRMPPAKWVAANLPRGARLGFDPWLLTPREVTRFQAACDDAGAELVAVARNPIDAVWKNRPAPPVSPVRPLAQRFAGRASADKRRDIAGGLAARGAHAVILSAPDSIAWLLNIRGQDLEFSPLALAFAIIARDRKVTLAIDPRKLPDTSRRHLGEGVRVIPPKALGAALDRLGAARRTVELDLSRAPAWILRRLKRAGAKIVDAMDPCLTPKAVKNRVELDGIRAAHLRDGAALVRFLAWFDREAPKGRRHRPLPADRGVQPPNPAR
jgi:Xaa-Pro aminopeptidase